MVWVHRQSQVLTKSSGKEPLGQAAPNQVLQQTPAAFWFFVLSRLASGRRC
jgi:hypothetical protein